MPYRTRHWGWYWLDLRKRRDEQLAHIGVLYLDVSLRGCVAFLHGLDRDARRARRLVQLTSRVGEILRDQPLQEVSR
jgi:hypothetical protein